MTRLPLGRLGWLLLAVAVLLGVVAVLYPSVWSEDYKWGVSLLTGLAAGLLIVDGLRK